MDLAAAPKIELHSHLDCCLSFEAAHRIEPSITREHYVRNFVAPPRCRSLADYLAYTMSYRKLLQSERALRIAVADVFSQMAADGIVYAELRFAPLIHAESGAMSADEVVACVSEETVAQITATGVEATLILCTLRNYSAEQSMETAQLVERHAKSGPVAAMDIAGDEIAFPLTVHQPAFDHVREAGLGMSIHAGEAGGPDSVREALDLTGTTRIGHGVRSVEDPELVARLAETGVHLEICPTCNVQTSAVESYESHPVKRLRQAGVPVSISTDTRAVTDVRLTQEYERLASTFGWTSSDVAQVNRDALAVAFAPPEVKARIAALLPSR